MFSEAERSIYGYEDGEGPRRGDPLVIEQRYFDALVPTLDTTDDFYDAIQRRLMSENPRIAQDASVVLLPAIAAAFGVEMLDEETGKGLTRSALYQLHNDFTTWREKVRRDFRTFARIVRSYGLDPSRPLTYLEYVGLAFNLPVVEALEAVQVARGIKFALFSKIHPSMVAAMADQESTIPWVIADLERELAEAAHAARMAARRPV
jgi:hypothetical protein